MRTLTNAAALAVGASTEVEVDVMVRVSIGVEVEVGVGALFNATSAPTPNTAAIATPSATTNAPRPARGGGGVPMTLTCPDAITLIAPLLRICACWLDPTAGGGYVEAARTCADAYSPEYPSGAPYADTCFSAASSSSIEPKRSAGFFAMQRMTICSKAGEICTPGFISWNVGTRSFTCAMRMFTLVVRSNGTFPQSISYMMMPSE